VLRGYFSTQGGATPKALIRESPDQQSVTVSNVVGEVRAITNFISLPVPFMCFMLANEIALRLYLA
jgi:2-methylisocitrate lyase-like PEP mutase family enzyme